MCVVSVVDADYRRGRLSGVVVKEGYRMVTIVGCRKEAKEADDLDWKGMVFLVSSNSHRFLQPRLIADRFPLEVVVLL